MRVLKLNLKKRSYNIVIADNAIKHLGRYISGLNIGSSAYVITNTPINKRHGKSLDKILKGSGLEVRFKLIPDTEKSKSIEMVSTIIRDLTAYDKKRRIFIVAFGGGVIGDLAGFIASIYRRGIAYIQLPTTLLAQVDSAIGGKTAVDLTQGKNLLGAFYQPKLVLSDIKFLKTLNARQIRNGLAEIIKYGIIKDARLFAYLEKNYRDIIKLKTSALEFIITRCSDIKAKIIQQDEREEKGMRTILNFGHTIGHAIEAAGRYKKYSHGEAIALGMLAACGVSKRLNLIDDSVAERIKGLIEKVNLPARIKNIPLSDIIKAHYRDKKFSGSKNKFVLIKGIGKACVKENIPLKVIQEAVKEIL
ncbi:MAG: 3-dehydroquinate synthase [Candidatus Omnitrophica bacterium]|nr:3-dehydroquinate synthase [Candidatus Omnitrophota bacterium]MDD5591714.1 3-dehydroquinate synthase [Candidatus Omnitrophota bacterium]